MMTRIIELQKRIDLHKAAIEKAQKELLKEIEKALTPPPLHDPSR